MTMRFAAMLSFMSLSLLLLLLLVMAFVMAHAIVGMEVGCSGIHSQRRFKGFKGFKGFDGSTVQTDVSD
jgi:hypothetical protein